MKPNYPSGYMHKILRVDLTKEEISEEKPNENTLRKYLGGTGLGIKYLYDEVPLGTQWNDPENRIVFATGPVGGTKIGGSGGFSVVTKGPLTNGATSTQANGFFGAFLKLSGFDGIIIHGAARRLLYLHIFDGTAVLRDATHLAGKDTWQTEDLIKSELEIPKSKISVYSIGPAGENLVKFACIIGDRGHVAAHNGLGAVMGSKNLKAIAVVRGKKKIEIADKNGLTIISKDIFEKVTGTPKTHGYRQSRWGTTGNVESSKSRLAAATLPVKNYTTTIFPKYIEFSREYIDPLFEIKRMPCWACKFNHCRIMKVKSGKYAGYVGDEPEYEAWAHWGPGIGQEDQIAAFVLSNETDRLGMDTNHAGWIIAWLMECYDKKLITIDDLDGIDMVWGNADAALSMLRKIALRQGIGDILAEGILQAVKHFGPEAGKLAIYTHKGNTPRAHDHRSRWHMMLDTCISDTGTDEGSTLPVNPWDVGLSKDTDPFSPEAVAKIVASKIYRMPFDDSLVMCRFNNRGPGIDMGYLANLLKVITGWDITEEETTAIGYRIVNLLRAFNIRHGLTVELDKPSMRYSSAPSDGPFQGISIKPVWMDIVKNFYGLMGWDVQTGKPLPQTLKDLGVESVIKDIW